MRKLRVKLAASLSRADAVVLIADGELEVRRGQLRAALLSDLQELARASGIRHACIHATFLDSRYELRFTGIPERLHQRFRNVWGANWP
jgi:hypothetical protein